MIQLNQDSVVVQNRIGDGARNRFLLLFALFVIGLSASLAFNGIRSLWDTSESRYAEAAREMVASGDWLTPRIAGSPHLTKPPMTYWLIALSIKAFGQSESAVRFPVALASALTVLITALFGWRLTGLFQAGLLAGILQMISPLAFMASHVVTTDTFISLWTVSYLFFMWIALTVENPAHARYMAWCMYLFLGVAFLTKGPPALLPALAALIFLVARRKYYHWKRLVTVPGLIMFVVVSFSWYIVIAKVVPDALAVWKLEAMHKVFVSSNRDMPALYYPLLLLGGGLPGMAIITVRLIGYRQGKGILSCPQREIARFLAVWVVVPLIIFMLSQTRMILYILPLIPAVNLLAATLSSIQADPAGSRQKIISPAFIGAAVIVLVALVGVKRAIAWKGDLSKDMKPVAEAIRQDANLENARPFLVFTMENMGNGLLYYLGGPPVERISRDKGTADFLSKSERLSKVLSIPLPPGSVQYIIADNTDIEKYRTRLNHWAELIYSNGQWGVFRRTHNGSIIL